VGTGGPAEARKAPGAGALQKVRLVLKKGGGYNQPRQGKTSRLKGGGVGTRERAHRMGGPPEGISGPASGPMRSVGKNVIRGALRF